MLKVYLHQLFLSNILFLIEGDYFNFNTFFKPYCIWGLSIEIQFYILFPLLILLIWKINRYIIHILVSLTIVSFLIHIFYSYSNINFAFYLFPARAWELLIGSIAFIYSQKNTNYGSDNNKSFYDTYLSIFGLALICLTIILYDENTKPQIIYNLIITLGTALVILFTIKILS